MTKVIAERGWTHSKYMQATALNKFQQMHQSQIPNKDLNGGPLSGIRILDLTRILAGPFATMILGDFGAEIIKVERPGCGDDTRSWGPPFVGAESCYFLCVNRNKRSIAIDLKKPKGAEIVRALAARSDVLIENFLPGTLDRYGLGYNDLSALSPALIYCSITGYGPTGPYKARPGYDVIAASIGGLLDVTGSPDGEPCKVGVAMTDLATGLYAHGAIMAAILERQKTGCGQKIDCNLLSTQISCLANLASNYLNGNIEARRLGTAHESIVPYQAFRTADKRYITIGSGGNEQFRALCNRLDLKNLIDDPNYSSNAQRVANRVTLLNVIEDQMMKKTSKEWMAILDGAPFPYGPVNSLSEAFADPQVSHSGIVSSVPHSTEGQVKLVGPAVTFSNLKNCIRSAPPTLGQHSEEILTQILVYTSSHINELVKEGVVQ